MTIPVADLRAAGLDEEVEALSKVVAQYLDDEKDLDRADSNVAVVSDPFAGRAALLDYAEELLGDDVVRVGLESVVTDPGRLPDIPSDRPLLVDDCQYLYRRCIGGFDVLDRFLERLAMTDTLVVTSWNRYAWGYLAAVRGVGESFPLEIHIPPLTAAQTAAVVTAHRDGDEPAFVDAGTAGRVKTVTVDRRPVSLPGDRTVDVPVVRANPAWLTSWTTRDADESIEAVVYEKLRRVSHGNPGIATTVWEHSVRETDDGAEIAPGYIEDPVTQLDRIDEPKAFLLLLVVSMESVRRATLEEVLDAPVDTDLQALASEGVVSVTDDRVRLEPVGLHPAVDSLRRRRML